MVKTHRRYRPPPSPHTLGLPIPSLLATCYFPAHDVRNCCGANVQEKFLPPKTWKRGIPSSGTWTFKLSLGASGAKLEGESEEHSRELAGDGVQQQYAPCERPDDDVRVTDQPGAERPEQRETKDYSNTEGSSVPGGFTYLHCSDHEKAQLLV